MLKTTASLTEHGCLLIFLDIVLIQKMTSRGISQNVQVVWNYIRELVSPDGSKR